MRRSQYRIGGIGILALLGLLPVISSGAPPEPQRSKSPAAEEKVIYSFAGGSDGAEPTSDLVLDTSGNLYGTTNFGGTGTACGSYGCGTVFELEAESSGWREKVLHSFQGGDDGAVPRAGLVFDAASNLYGTTFSGGGSEGPGTVFKLTRNSKGGWAESVIYRFTFEGSSGMSPSADLVMDAQGNLYGTTTDGGIGTSCGEAASGCGTVFELTLRPDGTWTESTLHQFAGAPGDGGIPSSKVALDSSGSVYGFTSAGGSGHCENYLGSSGCGTAYKLTPEHGTWTETVLYNFAHGLGRAVNPSAGIILEKTQLLVGTTTAGGDGKGTVFALSQSKKGWDQTVMHRFYGVPDGSAPVGQLAEDGQGNLFGATEVGGKGVPPLTNGMVFELYPVGDSDWKERILYGFTGRADGQYPEAGLVGDGHSHFYGTTSRGGAGSCGTVYEITVE